MSLIQKKLSTYRSSILAIESRNASLASASFGSNIAHVTNNALLTAPTLRKQVIDMVTKHKNIKWINFDCFKLLRHEESGGNTCIVFYQHVNTSLYLNSHSTNIYLIFNASSALLLFLITKW